MSTKTERDYGLVLGPFWWGYDLSTAAEFLSIAGQDLRWYGITIPGTRLGFGLIVKRRRTTTPDGAP
jgi:hypothetical protein